MLAARLESRKPCDQSEPTQAQLLAHPRDVAVLGSIRRDVLRVPDDFPGSCPLSMSGPRLEFQCASRTRLSRAPEGASQSTIGPERSDQPLLGGQPALQQWPVRGSWSVASGPVSFSTHTSRRASPVRRTEV